MNRYKRVGRFLMDTPWAILESKYEEILAIYDLHADGGKFTAEELRARLGAPAPRPDVRRGAVAVVPLHGVISHRIGAMSEMSGGMSTERFTAMFRQAMADDSVSAVLIDVDSPGGTITGVTELAHEIYAARGTKPIVAHVNALGASAAYWIASAADRIEVTPSGMVGSIGVITAFEDDSEEAEKAGRKRVVVSAGKYKAEGHGPISDEAIAAVQKRVDDAYAMMTKDIGRGRGINASAVRDGYGEGRIVSASDALKLGMVDAVATVDETIARIGKPSRAGMRAEVDAAILAQAHEVVHQAELDRLRRLERF